MLLRGAASLSYIDFKLNAELDVQRLASQFADARRCQVKRILPKELAVRVQSTLSRDTPWNYTYFDGQRAQTIPLETFAAMDPNKRQEILARVMDVAKQGFGYSYNSFNFHQRFLEGAFPGHPLREIDTFLNSEAFLGFARKLTGDPEICGTDASASWYGPDHFLNIHNDDPGGYDRRAAFVLNFSANWRTDWGGELKFFATRRGSELEGAYVPAFNVMNIFALPQYHSVGVVAPFAGAPRLSISGWLYAGEAPY
jgi:Rps23 Pro-64 3,4-dihydroxylase Tpa1-like proline 4-hydroxylase